jgi:hypothetical protein
MSLLGAGSVVDLGGVGGPVLVSPHQLLDLLGNPVQRVQYQTPRPVPQLLRHLVLDLLRETVVCDHGKAYISGNFQSSCRFLEIDFQPTHKGSPFEKGQIEKMLASAATMFAQYLSTYTGRNTDRRGRHLERERPWSLVELQELLDEGIVAAFTDRTARIATLNCDDS